MGNFWQRHIYWREQKMQLLLILAMAAGPLMTTSVVASETEPSGKEAVSAKANKIKLTAPGQAGRARKPGGDKAGQSKEDQAIDLVYRRADVKAWLKLFPRGTSKLGGHAAFTADHDEGDVYSVHVYEDLPDHTATFNWYEVNLKTGKSTMKC